MLLPMTKMSKMLNTLIKARLSLHQRDRLGEADSKATTASVDSASSPLFVSNLCQRTENNKVSSLLAKGI